jgi:hypothetical protein
MLKIKPMVLYHHCFCRIGNNKAVVRKIFLANLDAVTAQKSGPVVVPFNRIGGKGAMDELG